VHYEVVIRQADLQLGHAQPRLLWSARSLDTAPWSRDNQTSLNPTNQAVKQTLGKLGLEHHVLVGATLPVALAAPSPCLLVGQALRLGLLQRRLPYQDPLTLGRLRARLKRPPPPPGGSPCGRAGSGRHRRPAGRPGGPGRRSPCTAARRSALDRVWLAAGSLGMTQEDTGRVRTAVGRGLGRVPPCVWRLSSSPPSSRPPAPCRRAGRMGRWAGPGHDLGRLSPHRGAV
jgi:hypothetical protein